MGFGRLGGAVGRTIGVGTESSSCVGGEGVIEGIAVKRLGVVALPISSFPAETSPALSCNRTLTLLSRFLMGEEAPDTVPSRSWVEWRFPVVENASAVAAPARRGRACVVEAAAAF